MKSVLLWNRKIKRKLFLKMETLGFSDELYSLSFDSLEETAENKAWYTLIKKLTHEQLESLRAVFKNRIQDGEEKGLNKEEFLEAIFNTRGDSKYYNESSALFDDISKDQNQINWNAFLDFLLENITLKTDTPVYLHVGSLEAVPHMTRETIAKIVLIETEKYFCYAVVSKHGRVGIYDGNTNFLTSYQVLMTREDLKRTDDERRRKNRWVTDAIFCLDIQMFFVANSARSIAIYEASGLKHEPYWLIIGVHNIAECLAYKGFHQKKAEDKPNSILFAGTSNGDVILFKFLQPDNTVLRRKHTDKLTIFYWDELRNEKSYLKIQHFKGLHSCNVEQIEYCKKEDAILTCSKDPSASLVKKYISISKCPYIFKMLKGCNCFASSTVLNILVTGSDDKIIRVWNSVLVSHTIAVFIAHQEKIIDVAIMENQHTLLSFSEDGILKLWEFNENKCLQTLKMNYPCFNILGKSIEYGRNNIYPGPKRSSSCFATNDENNLYKKYFGISEIEERPKYSEVKKGGLFNKWERSNISVTCCNYIATIGMNFENKNIEKSNEMSILPPPPLQNSVLIPTGWQIPMKDFSNQSETSYNITEENIEALNFITNKDLFDIEGSRSDINYKIAVLEAKKIKMKSHVASGAPYLALDLTDFEELKLSDNLVIPETKEIRQIAARIRRRLEDAALRDKIFSEPSSSRSKKSSRSSIISIM